MNTGIKHVGLLFMALIVGLIFMWAFTLRNFAYSTLYRWNLIPHPERFTELYFDTYPQEISTTTGTTRTPDAFTFVIHNMEGAPTSYDYYVYFQSDAGLITPIHTNSIALEDGALTKISERLPVFSEGEGGKVFVELPSLHQSIDFFVPHEN